MQTAGPHSTVGIANLPNQRHKLASRKGASFNLMVVGESGTGKTTFLNTLFGTLLRDYKSHDAAVTTSQGGANRWNQQMERTVQIEITRLDVEEKGFPLRLSLIDSPGFGDYANNTDCWVPVVEYIDDQYYHYMRQEGKTYRSNVDDTRVHAVLYFVPTGGHTLRPIDIEVMKRLSARCNLIPVIAKADSLTPKDMAAYKERIRDCIRAHNIQIFSIPTSDEDEETAARISKLQSAIPYSVIASESEVTTPDGRRVRGRAYMWGVAEVENESHCDFKLLRSLLVRTHMFDLVNTTNENHYEAYRTRKLTDQGKSDDDPVSRARKQFEGKMKEEEDALRRRFTEQVRKEEQRFKEWEARLVSERDRLNADLAQIHAINRKLEKEIDELRNLQNNIGAANLPAANGAGAV